jgi:uncharacterized protein YjbJ (UPF0337 family)
MMDDNEIAGAAKDFGGKIKEGLGSAIGDDDLQAEGLADQVTGKAQKAYGAAKDAIHGAAETVRSAVDAPGEATSAGGFAQPILDFVKRQPALALLGTAAASYALALLVHRGKS